jgi:hypothetical protein
MLNCPYLNCCACMKTIYISCQGCPVRFSGGKNLIKSVKDRKLFEGFDVQFQERGPWASPTVPKFPHFAVYIFILINIGNRKGPRTGPCNHRRAEKGPSPGAVQVLRPRVCGGCPLYWEALHTGKSYVGSKVYAAPECKTEDVVAGRLAPSMTQLPRRGRETLRSVSWTGTPQQQGQQQQKAKVGTQATMQHETHTRTHTHMHPHTRVHTYIYTLHTHAHARSRAHAHAHAAHVRTSTHAHDTHTHIHTHTYTHICSGGHHTAMVFNEERKGVNRAKPPCNFCGLKFDRLLKFNKLWPNFERQFSDSLKWVKVCKLELFTKPQTEQPWILLQMKGGFPLPCRIHKPTQKRSPPAFTCTQARVHI